jgi:hypothetical protein
MDHCGLLHLFAQNDLNVRQGRWSELLIEYDLEISFLKGTMNREADVLSQRSRICLVIPLQTNVRDEVLTTARR